MRKLDDMKIQQELADIASKGKRKEKEYQSWPKPMGRAAYHGVIGHIVDTIEPHTEADANAILVQFLVVIGNVIGRGVGFQQEATRHYTNLYTVIVGDSSKARKGTGLGYALELVRIADSEYETQRIARGLSSGEGLVFHIRDETTKMVRPKDASPEGEEWIKATIDPGILDKRLLVVEEEFARVLKVMKRDGNTLSTELRGLFDKGDGGSLTKTDPLRCRGGHVSIISHIVKDELRRELTDTEMANGFGNRFLFACSRRSKLLPHGSSLDLTTLAFDLSNAIKEAKLIGKGPPMALDTEARELWEEQYETLSEAKQGLVGAITSRGEALVKRIAVIYAAIDGCLSVRYDHLRAALEVWRYCEDSATYIFGDSTGDVFADEILTALRVAEHNGLTRNDIVNSFSRHRTDRIKAGLVTLTNANLAVSSKERTGGRPAERWYASEFAPSRGSETSEKSEKSPL